MSVTIENLVTSGTFSLAGVTPDRHLADGDAFQVGGATLRAIHTPGHSPGSTCFHLEEEATVFTGDTLFNGGPGATGRSYSDYPTILTSIRERLLTLPATGAHRPRGQHHYRGGAGDAGQGQPVKGEGRRAGAEPRPHRRLP